MVPKILFYFKYLGMKGLFNFSEVATYFFRKKDPNRKTNFNLRSMHFINKLSMLMFLIALFIIIFRHVF